MRIGRGCEHCRHRHIRCVVQQGASACNACVRLNRRCRLDPRFHFKSVRHVYQNPSNSASKFELTWGPEQVWVSTPHSLTFVQDSLTNDPPLWNNPEALSKPQGESQTYSTAVGPIIDTPTSTSQSQSFSGIRGTGRALELPQIDNTDIPSTPSLAGELRIPSTSAAIPPSHGNNVQCQRSLIPSTTDCTDTTPPWSPPDAPSTASPNLTAREAFLLRAFIQKIAPWVDICDFSAHFTTEVPRRALEVTMVLKALLALAASHDAILTGANDWEASAYHGQCLELLIAALARPEDTYDDNLLITVVILRIHEELGQSIDQKCHLLGSNRLLNTMSKSASSGGLAEAVSWQFLRQAIYASVVQSQPLQLDLQNYERSSVFYRTDDAAYANSIVFLCARIVQLCTGPDACTVEEATWRELAHSVEQWHTAKPITWQALRYREADVAEDRPFPELWMISPPAVVGLQYYHAARVILTASDARWHPGSDYELARSRRMAEKSIAGHLMTVIGLSLSNETVQNAYFMACHLLHRYGYCLRHAAEQKGSLDFLAHAEKALGWRTSWIFEELEQQWRELQAMDAWECGRADHGEIRTTTWAATAPESAGERQ